MEWISLLIGSNHHPILWWQVAIRAFVMFVVSLFLIRLAGVRTFGKRSGVDIVTLFLLGAVLARGVPGDIAFFPTVLAGLIIASLHRLLSVAAYFFPPFARLLKGKNLLLFSDGNFYRSNLRRLNLSEEEVIESVRRCLHTEDLSRVEKIYFEPSGRITVLRKNIAKKLKDKPEDSGYFP